MCETADHIHLLIRFTCLYVCVNGPDVQTVFCYNVRNRFIQIGITVRYEILKPYV